MSLGPRIPSFQKVAEPSPKSAHTTGRSDDINHPKTSSTPLLDTSPRPVHQDLNELPDSLWISRSTSSPSSSSGGHPPEASDAQLDRLYGCEPSTSSRFFEFGFDIYSIACACLSLCVHITTSYGEYIQESCSCCSHRNHCGQQQQQQQRHLLGGFRPLRSAAAAAAAAAASPTVATIPGGARTGHQGSNPLPVRPGPPSTTTTTTTTATATSTVTGLTTAHTHITHTQHKLREENAYQDHNDQVHR